MGVSSLSLDIENISSIKIVSALNEDVIIEECSTCREWNPDTKYCNDELMKKVTNSNDYCNEDRYRKNPWLY
mgnify:CR=1 FL=1